MGGFAAQIRNQSPPHGILGRSEHSEQAELVEFTRRGGRVHLSNFASPLNRVGLSNLRNLKSEQNDSGLFDRSSVANALRTRSCVTC